MRLTAEQYLYRLAERQQQAADRLRRWAKAAAHPPQNISEEILYKYIEVRNQSAVVEHFRELHIKDKHNRVISSAIVSAITNDPPAEVRKEIAEAAKYLLDKKHEQGTKQGIYIGTKF